MQLEHVSEYKYLGCFLDVSSTDKAEYHKKAVSGRRVTGAIMSLVKAKDLQLECARVLHETLLVPVLTYGRERMMWKEERYSRAVQMDNLRNFIGVRSPECTDKEILRSDKGGERKEW